MNQDGAPTDLDIQAEVQNHADAIIRACSYYPSEFGDFKMVVHTRPDHMEQVQASLQSPFETLPTATLGMLDNLPVELIYIVLRHLDIRSFFRFRQVNRLARFLAAGIKDYRMVSRYGLEGLRGLLRVGIADYFDISDLYRPLKTNKCSTRCCFSCLEHSDHYFILPRRFFVNVAHISTTKLQRLAGPASLQVVPGFYRPMGLYDWETGPIRPNNVRYSVHVERATQMLLAADVINQDVASTRGFNIDRQPRCAAATAYPRYSLENAKLERGVSCYCCRPFPARIYYTIRHFSTEGFLSHFSTCMTARDEV
ncbi:hypothetical protein V8F33_004856 [Rhypophila sp. PSN 637]